VTIEATQQENQMHQNHTLTILKLATAISISLSMLLSLAARAEEDVTETVAASVNVNYQEFKENFSVKRLFASRCSWCHQGYGLKEADGPRLSGTALTRDEVIHRISRGKSPMPGFRKQLKPWQIEALADYIKALPDVEL
jgi:mono/diheme cytochrome c family protein